MPRPPEPYRLESEGQIALEQALFGLDCELIFAGTGRCPGCGEEVWPMAQSLSRPATSELVAAGMR